MKKYPAIAVIEFSSIADGIYTTDAILKKAPIAMIKGGTGPSCARGCIAEAEPWIRAKGSIFCWWMTSRPS